MAVTKDYRAYVEDRLGSVATIATKSMFGGVGIYAEGLFMAVVDNDILYFKVDDTNRDDYVSAGMNPFSPYPDKDYVMAGYYSLPEEVLEDDEVLAEWVAKSVEVARRAKKGGKGKKGS